MITSEDPVGDWTWELTPSDTHEGRPARAVEIAAAIWDILARHELAAPAGKGSFSVRSVPNARDILVDVKDIAFEGKIPQPDTVLSRSVTQAEAVAQGDTLVSFRVQCPGYWLESGAKHRAEKLFVVQVDIWKSSLLVVTLETYSDVWLTMDTREREQDDVHAENAPRLAAALESISALLDSSPAPGDPNRHATPTETGFEDARDEGPAYVDSWGTFEVPARSRRLRSSIPPSEDEYPETTDHPVRYFTVQRGDQILGYLWASVGEEAAGYEPRTAAGDEAFEAGSEWLLRLREAHARGLTALAALDWLAHLSPRPEIGDIFKKTPAQAPSLDSLEELSGRY
ncbi:hypothetical protein [Streptomyces sclerotialus]|uniref:hypothetical protein n=1 Tax=Streptomyces sclerotialus TaxID=1957 RepID=UPI0004C8B863